MKIVTSIISTLVISHSAFAIQCLGIQGSKGLTAELTTESNATIKLAYVDKKASPQFANHFCVAKFTSKNANWTFYSIDKKQSDRNCASASYIQVKPLADRKEFVTIVYPQASGDDHWLITAPFICSH